MKAFKVGLLPQLRAPLRLLPPAALLALGGALVALVAAVAVLRGRGGL